MGRKWSTGGDRSWGSGPSSAVNGVILGKTPTLHGLGFVASIVWKAITMKSYLFLPTSSFHKYKTQIVGN